MSAVFHQELSRRARSGDKAARSEMAAIAHAKALPYIKMLVRDNALYELEDAIQEAWAIAFQGVDKDRGVGDPVAFVVNHIKWRIRDWSSSRLRRHAYLVCRRCAHTQAIEAVQHRECRRCGAGSSEIDSVTFQDYGKDGSDRTDLGIDTSRPEVQEFVAGRSQREQSIIEYFAFGYTRPEVAQKLGLSPSRISQITRDLRAAWLAHVAASRELTAA